MVVNKEDAVRILLDLSDPDVPLEQKQRIAGQVARSEVPGLAETVISALAISASVWVESGIQRGYPRDRLIARIADAYNKNILEVEAND